VLGPDVRHGANIRNYNAFVPKKEQRMVDFVDEPDYDSNGIDEQRESRENWRAINRRHLPAVQEQHAREKRRRELEGTEQRRVERRDRDIPVYSSDRTRKTAD
jgi:hypothetical protein